MRNRAKCKLCSEIIESFHHHDFVTCKCGEISVDGGQQHFKASAKDFNNFVRIDDENKEITVKFVEEPETLQAEEVKTILSREDLMNSLRYLIETYEKLPPQAMQANVTHYDLHSVLLLLQELLRDSL